jgi:hypothetical protein
MSTNSSDARRHRREVAPDSDTHFFLSDRTRSRCSYLNDAHVTVVNGWVFPTSRTHLGNGSMRAARGDPSELVASCACGARNFFAEWRRFPPAFEGGKDVFRLIVAPYLAHNAFDEHCPRMGCSAHIVNQVFCIGDVIAYCARHRHPHRLRGLPL